MNPLVSPRHLNSLHCSQFRDFYVAGVNRLQGGWFHELARATRPNSASPGTPNEGSSL